MPVPEDPFSQLTEQLGDVYFFRTPQTGEIVYLSASFEELFKRQRDRAYEDASDWLQALHPDDRDRVSQQLRQHRLSGTTYEDQYRILWPDGSLHPVVQRSWLATVVDQPARYVSVVQRVSASLPSIAVPGLRSESAQTALAHLLNSPVAVIVSMRVYADCHWEWDYFSAGCERLFGFSVAELTQDNQLWISRVHPDDVAGVIMPLLEDIFAECDQAPHEYRFYKKDGEMRWMQGNLSSRCDPHGDFWTVTIVTIDITTQKQTEANLQHSQSLLQQITDGLPQTLYIFNLQQHCNEYINPHIQTVLGLAPEEIQQGNLLAERFHPEELTALERHFASWQQMPDGVAKEFEYRMRHRDGQWRWLRSREVVFERDAQGHPIKLLGTAVDVTDEKQAEANLRAILRSIPMCVARFRIFATGRFHYEYISPGSQTIWGYTPEAIMADMELWSSHIHPDDWAGKLLPLLYTPIMARQDQYLEYRFRHPTRGWRWIAVNLAANEELTHHSWGMTTVSWDISDRKHLELALQRQTRQERLLHRITVDMRQSLELDRILATAVKDVRQSFNADRALIFQLLTDGSGQVIQESVLPEYPVTDQMRWLDEDFPPDCYNHYRQGLPRIVPDIATDAWAMCLVEFMQEVGVQSKMVAPIVHKDSSNQAQVWGLLIVHACADQRQWRHEEAQTLQKIADQLAIAIQQASLYKQLQAANHQLSHLATTDPLTQLANRRAFDEYLRQEWARMARDQGEISLILCDIDHFKLYNDTFGHPAGDTCLIRVAAVIRDVIKRPGDFVARYGGEEFIIVLPRTHGDGAIRIIQDVQERFIAQPIPHQASPIENRITLSFGVAWGYPAVLESAEQMLEAADRALYAAKLRGRNCFQMHTLL